MNRDICLVMNDNSVDDHVDTEIQTNLKEHKSFFVFAGAGSGKTRSLVNSINYIGSELGDQLRQQSKRVAVITYTNAACDEIMRRVGYNSLFAVSTIHSFLWELIKPYQKDIKVWVKVKLENDITELEEKQNSPRRRSDYSEVISKKKTRLDNLEKISKFTYNPNGENIGRDSLNHAEVIAIGSCFIANHETMQRVFISKFPILLIDESQDTKKELIDALWKVNEIHSGELIIGMFGDTMQRIYTDGKENLSDSIPKEWEKPKKEMNHRSNKRIIQLANAIRATIDNQEQRPRSDKSEGFVRLFVVSNAIDKDVIEQKIYAQMANITSDKKWIDVSERKVLVLEHSMAANRIGFETLNNELARQFDQSFRDGTLPELSFLMNVIYQLVQAKQKNENFAVMRILKQYSPLLKRDYFSKSTNQKEVLGIINKEVSEIVSLWANDKQPLCIDVYKKLRKLTLFELSERIKEVLSLETEVSDRIGALRNGLNVSFSELINYWDYVQDKTQFSTHQGVKGLEYDRVSVIMDDESAGGFLFSYEKLFGAKQLTDTDKNNQKEGKDNSITRTMRLFYVTCTRAIESLAIIAYTNNAEAVKKTAISNSWFKADEVIIMSTISA